MTDITTLGSLAEMHVRAYEAIKELTDQKRGLEADILEILEFPIPPYKEHVNGYTISTGQPQNRKTLDRKMLDVLARERINKGEIRTFEDFNQLLQDCTINRLSKAPFKVVRS